MLSKEETLDLVRKFNPDVMGFRLDTYNFHQTLSWIRYLKKNINIPVIVGGINLLLYPEESLYYPEIDYGVIGEAIESLPKLLLAIESGEGISSIEGIVYRNDGQIKVNPASKKFISFNSYPFPARHLLLNQLYYSFVSQRKNFTIMVTSKGCPYKCLFCAISSLPYLERSPKNVVDEIEECYKNYNIREIDFFDAVFFFNKERALNICREIVRRKIKIEWSCRSRVDLVDDELLEAASIAGCRQIYFGIESANPEILKAINKNTNLKQVKEAIAISKEYNIKTLGFFMLGNPGESKETIAQTIKLSKQLGLNFVQFCRTIAKPGSGLNIELKEKYNRDYWRDYILGKIQEQPFPTPWTALTYKEITRYLKKAYLSFYFRPLYILKTVFKAKSLSELFRYIRVALKMIISFEK